MSDFCYLFLAVVCPIAIVSLIFNEKKQDNALFYGNHFQFMFNSTSIKTATKMLELHASTNIHFTGETAAAVESLNASFKYDTLKALAPAADGRTNRYNFFQLAIALDTHLHPKCYWMIHQEKPDSMTNKIFVYQTEMRDTIGEFFSALAALNMVDDPVPPVFQRWINLLNPWDDSVSFNNVLALFFVWRRCALDRSDSLHAVANLSAFKNEKKNVLSLRDWMELIYNCAIKESESSKSKALENLIFQINHFDFYKKNIDDYDDATFAVTNSMLFYLHAQYEKNDSKIFSI